MIRITCNRCGKEIKGTTYYTIDIKDRGVCSSCYEASSSWPYSAHATAPSVQSAFESIYGQEHYCEECIDKIRDFIKKQN